MKYRVLLPLVGCLLCSVMAGASPVKRTPLADGWRFCLGHAADPQQDFGCGTEYFNFLTKANSIHNTGPYALSFNDSAWTPVQLPHDWVPGLPFEAQASHSHGYHAIGWRYPEHSVGWYRRTFSADSTMLAGPTRLVFDGIFRDARVWVNGFYLGREESGYIRHTYDITDYLTPENNLICVRVDASLEEGWFYEGAGIYRAAWIETGIPQPTVTSPETARYTWSVDSGFMVDGRKMPLRGVNLHIDHAGVGTAIPKGLWEYRLRALQAIGVNAIRCSHNPASEEFLDLCDSLGIYVIAETRLLGSSRYERHVLEEMIRRDMHHKCIILWSVGNEEWGVEWTDRGERIARTMTDWVHELDPSRPSTCATSSGPNIIRGVDVAGYNYILQNKVDDEHRIFPKRIAYGSEETTGCGTRGVTPYTLPNDDKGHMASMNYPVDTFSFAELQNVSMIERGMQFYAARPWLAGLFYWTGFDYMGEPNPLSWPAVGSEFGVLDACGFPKDEAYYLQACWTDEPMLHILPHWNLQGAEGDTVPVWVYSNMDEVELRVNGRSLGKKAMPKLGHSSWKAVYQPGKVEAIGYKKGKKVLTETVYTAGPAAKLSVREQQFGDVRVLDVTLLDEKGHFCPTDNSPIVFNYSGAGRVLGCGNGDPACHLLSTVWQDKHRFTYPAFNGHAQFILQGEVTDYHCSLAPVSTIDIHPAKPTADIAPTMYGIFFEDINYGADGGLYAEMVKNRSFEFPDHLMGWTLKCKYTLANDGPFPRNPYYLNLQSGTIENEGFFGFAYKEGAEYRFSVWARAAAPENLNIALLGDKGEKLAEGNVTVSSPEWKRYTLVLRASASTTRGKLALSGANMSLEHVSLFPVDTWQGHENGLRRDLVEALRDLHPGVFRFPGGCVVEGNTLPTRYNWKNSVGPVENRPLNENRWLNAMGNRYSPDYYQSLGMGFYEYFLLAEELGAAPLPVLNAGMACEFVNDPTKEGDWLVPLDSLQPYVDDALDLIAFANDDPATNKWAALRAEMGHPAPFGLKYLAIGNEQWGRWFAPRLKMFSDQIRAKYPDIQLVGTAGPSPEGEEFETMWREMRELKADLVDEHYYHSVEWFLKQATRYDTYSRKGPKVFAGEYACHATGISLSHNHYAASLAEAALMTGLERNADVVRMATYAPLFAHEEGWQWRPDLIWFNNSRVVRSASYYVQQLFMTNMGTHVLPTLSAGKPLAGQDGLYATSSLNKKTGEVIIKMVNIAPEDRRCKLNISGSKGRRMVQQIALLPPADEEQDNSFEAPDAIVPVSSSMSIDFSRELIDVPARSVLIIRIPK